MTELTVTARAEEARAPVPHVLCVVLWPLAGPFWSALIGTREEPQAEDLSAAWRARKPGPERWALLRQVGRAIRRLHDAGLEHPDLQVRNVLLCPGPPQRIVVIDLDRARFRAIKPVSVRARARNLGRLFRSAVKEGLFDPRSACRELAVLIGGYTRRDRELRRALLRRVPWERAALAVHRIGYAFRNAFGA
jgi:3-deoxy-D-manno-octulosonic acid kinase